MNYIPEDQVGAWSENTSKYTHIKHANFEAFLKQMWVHWFNDEPYDFAFIDLNAGSGYYPTGEAAMCMRFLENFATDPMCKMTLLHGSLYEKAKVSRERLKNHVDDTDLPNINIFKDQKSVLSESSDMPGLILYDPNGNADFNFVNEVLSKYPNMDLFMHLQPAKEQRSFWKENANEYRKHIHQISRKHILLSKKYGGYIDCVATTCLPIKLKRTSKFMAINAVRGKKILQQLAYKWTEAGVTGFTTKRFIREAKAIHGDKYDYTDTIFNGTREDVEFICPIHGKVSTNANKHLNKNGGCPQCTYDNFRKLYAHTTEEFIKLARKKHGDKYGYQEVIYFNNRTKIPIICPEHGRFYQTPADHLKGCRCPKCKYINAAKKQAKTTEQFIKEARERFGDKFDYSKVVYVNALTKVIIICPKHGEFRQRPNDHLSSVNGCRKCGLENRKSKKK